MYCEEDTAQDKRDEWNIKEKGTGRQWKNNKGYTDCGDMIENFPAVGGEWRCKDEQKMEVAGSTAPFKGSCVWGCNEGGKFKSKSARFTCYRPWIGQASTKWENKEAFRKFKGMGVRIFRQGLMQC